MKRSITFLVIATILALISIACTAPPAADVVEEPQEEAATVTASEEGDLLTPEIPEVRVEFCHAPYLDHTQSIIGLEKGWFDEVGVTFEPEPYGSVPATENAVQALASGACDVLSASAIFMLPSINDVPPYKWFVHGDIFQGYALMGQPDAGYKSVDEFIEEGNDPREAMALAVAQLEGKRFAYPSEAPIKGFINLALEQADMTLDDVQSIVAEDAKTWSMMLAGQADFQVGGVPSRLTLETKGFKPIITSQHLAQYAEPSAESEELRAIFHDGWGALDQWIDNNYDTMLRMSSVMFRIAEFQNEHRGEALEIHVPFLNSAAGTDIDTETAIVVYESLDPFVPFEGQRSWYLDYDNPINYDYVTGAHIKMWEERGLFELGEVQVEDISIAKDVYEEFLEMQAQSETLFEEAEAAIADAEESGGNPEKAQELLDQARYWYDAYNYLDAIRWAEAAITWAEDAAE